MPSIKVEHSATQPPTMPRRRSISSSASPEKSPKSKKTAKKGKQANPVRRISPRRQKSADKDAGSSTTKVGPVDEDPDAPIHVNLQSKAQKRKTLKTNVKLEDETEDVQEARRREKERLERLEKLKSKAPTASSYESVPASTSLLMNFIMPVKKEEETKEMDQCLVLKKEKLDLGDTNKQPFQSDEQSAFDENTDDDVILDRVIAKPQIETIDLSSDDEEQLDGRRLTSSAYVQGISSKKFTSPQRQEELRMRRLKRADETLDKMVVTEDGQLLVNEGKPKDDPEVFVSKYLTPILQPHQLGGIRFMYDNVIESLKEFNPNAGFGCILAHSMGLGKSIQTIAFIEIFFRVTSSKRALIICPINVIQNWQQEFNKWLPQQEGIRDFSVYLLGDLVKTQTARLDLVSKWENEGGVLLLGYEMFRLLTMKRRKKKIDEAETTSTEHKNMSAEEASEVFYKALVDPGADLVVCDEGHRIKNLKTDVASALSAIKTRRRIVLTGYPLQNNLIEYYCMVDFVRPAYLGSKKHFSLMFDRPIKNGMCIDSTKRDVKIARQRTHVLTNMVRGFVQRRTHHLLKKILPENMEYVLFVRKTPAQKRLYREFVRFISKELTTEDANYYNPLKAHAVCSKIWNHPDLLYKAWERQLELLDYSQLADAIDAQEGKLPETSQQPTNQYNNTPFSASNGFPTQSNGFYNQFPSNMQNSSTNQGMYNQQNQILQTPQPFNNNQYFNGQNNFPPQSTPNSGNQFQQQMLPFWNNGSQFVMQNPMNSNNLPEFSSNSNGSAYNQMGSGQAPEPPKEEVKTKRRGRKRNNGDVEDSEFDKAAKKKKPAKRKLVQLITDDDEGGSIPYYWADSVMGDYVQGVLGNSHKMLVALTIIQETIKRGEKILLFSTSLLTLSLIEDFLREHGSIQTDDGFLEWKKNSTYFRFDGSTSAVDREKMIAQFNADPSVRLFLISTRAGSLGVNLVSASRVIIFDASWNPCHDAQAVCRIYRYGQKNKTYIYRLIMSNCMEQAIFSRQISKHGLQQRVVDEQLIDANVTQKELENLIAYDEFLDADSDEVNASDWKVEDELLRSITLANPRIFAKCPFPHESLMLESEEQLSTEEKMEAEILYEREKKGLLYTSHLNPSEAPAPSVNSGLIMPMPSAYNSMPLFMQPGNMGRLPLLPPNPSMFMQPTMGAQFNGSLQRMPAAINGRPMVTNPTQRPISMQFLSSNPPKINSRPVNRSAHVTESRRIKVDEDLVLNSVTNLGKKVQIRAGDPVFVIKTTAGSVYLRDMTGQLMDATQTKYAKPPEPRPEEIIELD